MSDHLGLDSVSSGPRPGVLYGRVELLLFVPGVESFCCA
jgi:hypothetical protein